jgi:hypothetical protein
MVDPMVDKYSHIIPVRSMYSMKILNNNATIHTHLTPADVACFKWHLMSTTEKKKKKKKKNPYKIHYANWCEE